MRLFRKISLSFLAICFVISLHAQDQVIDFEFLTSEQIKSNLTALEGEVVYLSFWATWCKPCIQNFKKYHAFRETLLEEGVYLLNINLDKDPSKYEAFLKKSTTLNGVNARPVDLSQLSIDYKISSIPEYHIINKFGDFVFLSESPDRDILAEFKNWLSE